MLALMRVLLQQHPNLSTESPSGQWALDSPFPRTIVQQPPKDGCASVVIRWKVALDERSMRPVGVTGTREGSGGTSLSASLSMDSLQFTMFSSVILLESQKISVIEEIAPKTNSDNGYSRKHSSFHRTRTSPPETRNAARLQPRTMEALRY